MSGSPGLAGGAPHRPGSGTLTPRLLGGEPRWEETPAPGPSTEGPRVSPGGDQGCVRLALLAWDPRPWQLAVRGTAGGRWPEALPALPLALPPPALPHRVHKVGAFHDTQSAPQLGREGGSSRSRGRGRRPSSFSTAGPLSRPKWPLREGPARGPGQTPWQQGAWGPGWGRRAEGPGVPHQSPQPLLLASQTEMGLGGHGATSPDLPPRLWSPHPVGLRPRTPHQGSQATQGSPRTRPWPCPRSGLLLPRPPHPAPPVPLRGSTRLLGPGGKGVAGLGTRPSAPPPGPRSPRRRPHH